MIAAKAPRRSELSPVQRDLQRIAAGFMRDQLAGLECQEAQLVAAQRILRDNERVRAGARR